MTSRFSSLAVLLALSGAAAGATVESIMPTPGLYLVETSARDTHHAPRTSIDFKPRQDRYCIRGGNLDAAALALVSQSQAQCPRRSTKVVGETVVMTAQCQSTTLHSVTRRVARDVWESETRIETVASVANADLGQMRPALEAMAANGNAQERAQARRQLDQLPAMQASLDRQRATMAEQLKAARAKARTQMERDLIDKHLASLTEQGGPPDLTSVVKKRMTRIADNCPAEPAAR